jgi:SLT domain-containing protein
MGTSGRVTPNQNLAASIAALSGSAVAARALGGQVRGGQSYLVGERGPELLHMGTSGRVTPNQNLAASIAALSGSAVAARALGGQVRGGQSYLVGERGPELLHMGTSGRVTPNQNLGLGLNASAMSVMAGLSAFASTAAIPIVGPVAAPAAAAAAVAVTAPMAASIAALSGSAVAARALGGQVRGGQSYLVGERGPELLHMGTSGRVTPNQNLGGGGSVSIVNNIDASSAGPDLEIKIQQAMINTSRQTVSKIQDLMRRGRL